MRVTGPRGLAEVSAHQSEEEEFFKDTIQPPELALLRPADSRDLPPILVVMVTADGIDANLRRLLDARALRQDNVDWVHSIAGNVGWTSRVTRSGDAEADAEASYARLDLDLIAPMPYKTSYLFHIAQVRSHVAAVVEGGLFAVALPELVAHCSTLTYTEAMNSLPFFVLPRAPRLAEFLRTLDVGG